MQKENCEMDLEEYCDYRKLVENVAILLENGKCQMQQMSLEMIMMQNVFLR